ncbi:hypothetical protein ACGGAQ_20210 [Micromonospora sp. NPDC047557]|uniref:hypothetical protein n=1 Tax=Micromonospora sp. NPDC047557 TaxID=3364250 RepID=UPI0037179DD5
MFKKLETLGGGLLGLFVPKIEASATASACYQQTRCVTGTSGCNATGHRWRQYRIVCDDGSATAWQYLACGC